MVLDCHPSRRGFAFDCHVRESVGGAFEDQKQTRVIPLSHSIIVMVQAALVKIEAQGPFVEAFSLSLHKTGNLDESQQAAIHEIIT